jgi:hypothetical protein
MYLSFPENGASASAPLHMASARGFTMANAQGSRTIASRLSRD